MWRKIVQSTYRRKARERPASLDDRIAAYRDFIGDLAFYWGVIENNLDAWIEHIHENGGANKIQSFLPASLDRELDYLKDALRMGFVPPDHEDRARETIQEIHSLKVYRHTHLHGVVDAFREDGRVVVKHSRVRGSVLIRSVSTYSFAQLARQHRRTHDLMLALYQLLTSDGFGVMIEVE